MSTDETKDELLRLTVNVGDRFVSLYGRKVQIAGFVEVDGYAYYRTEYAYHGIRLEGTVDPIRSLFSKYELTNYFKPLRRS